MVAAIQTAEAIELVFICTVAKTQADDAASQGTGDGT